MGIEVVEGSSEGHEDTAEKVLESLEAHAGWMGLDDWTFKVRWVPVENEYCMETLAEPEYYKATLSVDLVEIKVEHIDEYIRHELLHVHLWLFTSLAQELSTKRGGKALEKMEEHMVSTLERMPLWEELYEKN